MSFKIINRKIIATIPTTNWFKFEINNWEDINNFAFLFEKVRELIEEIKSTRGNLSVYKKNIPTIITCEDFAWRDFLITQQKIIEKLTNSIIIIK